jgi:hypothetical protein
VLSEFSSDISEQDETHKVYKKQQVLPGIHLFDSEGEEIECKFLNGIIKDQKNVNKRLLNIYSHQDWIRN